MVFLANVEAGSPQFTSLADEIALTLTRGTQSVSIRVRRTGDVYEGTPFLTPTPTPTPTPTLVPPTPTATPTPTPTLAPTATPTPILPTPTPTPTPAVVGDSDGDGFVAGTAPGTDCYDLNANARPNLPAGTYFTTTRGTSAQGNDTAGNTWNSYDYNCDGTETKQLGFTGCTAPTVTLYRFLGTFICTDIGLTLCEASTGAPGVCGGWLNWDTNPDACGGAPCYTDAACTNVIIRASRVQESCR